MITVGMRIYIDDFVEDLNVRLNDAIIKKKKNRKGVNDYDERL